MKQRLRLVIFMGALIILAGPSSAEKEEKGYGAGGIRAEHASEQGLEKGKAWAGSKEKKDKDEDSEKKEKKEKKKKKDKD